MRRPAITGNATVRTGLLCAAVAVFVNAVMVHEVGLSGDEPYYDRMAVHPGGPHNFPYAFRIGVPGLVHVLPFSRGFSWIAIALVAASIAGAAMYALLVHFHVRSPLATGLAVGFAVSPPLLVTFLRNGISVDPVAIMLITQSALFIARRQLVALGIVLLLGTTVHEACLFAIPLAYAVWAETVIDRRALRDVAIVALVPALVYVYVRASITAVGEQYQPGYNGLFFNARFDVIRSALHGHGWVLQLRRLAVTYGPLWVAAPFALRDQPFARRGLVLVALCAGAMTFSFDWDRLMFFAAPVVYVAAGWAVRNRWRLATAMVIGLLAVDAGYALYMQVHGVRHGLDHTGPPARGPVF